LSARQLRRNDGNTERDRRDDQVRILQFDNSLRRCAQRRASVLQREVPQSRCATVGFATDPGGCNPASCVGGSPRPLPEVPKKWACRRSHKSQRVVGRGHHLLAQHHSHFVPSMWHQRTAERCSGFHCTWLVGNPVGVACDAGTDCPELPINDAGSGSDRAVGGTFEDRTAEDGFTCHSRCSNAGVGSLTRGSTRPTKSSRFAPSQFADHLQR
jgi:hypothetical protein